MVIIIDMAFSKTVKSTSSFVSKAKPQSGRIGKFGIGRFGRAKFGKTVGFDKRAKGVSSFTKAAKP